MNFVQPTCKSYIIAKHLIQVECAVCGTLFKTRKNRVGKYCSTKCNGKVRCIKLKGCKRGVVSDKTRQLMAKRITGELNPSWKGGVTYNKKKGNYLTKLIKYVRCPDAYISMARTDGYIAKHRLAMAEMLGRALCSVEVVHHIDHNPANNHWTNLMLFSNNGDHIRFEHNQVISPVWQPSHLFIEMDLSAVIEYIGLEI